MGIDSLFKDGSRVAALMVALFAPALAIALPPPAYAAPAQRLLLVIGGSPHALASMEEATTARRLPVETLQPVPALPAGKVSNTAAASDYHDLSGTPEAFRPVSLSEKRADRLDATIARISDVLLLGANLPPAGPERSQFIKAHQGFLDNTTASEFAQSASELYANTQKMLLLGADRDLPSDGWIRNGRAPALSVDDALDRYEQNVTLMETAQRKIDENGGFDLAGLGFPTNHTADAMISIILGLGRDKIPELNTALALPDTAGNQQAKADAKSETMSSIASQLLNRAHLSGPDEVMEVLRSERIKSLMTQQMNGEVHLLRAMVKLTEAGLAQGDKAAEDMVNVVGAKENSLVAQEMAIVDAVKAGSQSRISAADQSAPGTGALLPGVARPKASESPDF